MSIQNTLKKIGLSEDEIAVYLAALALGPSLVAKIAKHSCVKRTTVYLVAKALMKKGLIGEYRTPSGAHLSAQSPEYLLTKIEEQKKEVAEILPELKALTKKEAYSPQVKYFEGKEGYFTVAEDSLQKHASEILWLGNSKELYKIIGKEWDDKYYVPKRLERKIKMRSLLLEDEWSKELKTNDEKFLRQTRFLPDNNSFSSAELIYQNKIAYFSSTKELTCVLIESRDLSELERAKFEMLWKANNGNN